MNADQGDILRRVAYYQDIVLRYEAIDQQIDDLIMAHGGLAENMSPEDLALYRDLARQRDDLQNEMRALEKELLMDDDTGA